MSNHEINGFPSSNDFGLNEENKNNSSDFEMRHGPSSNDFNRDKESQEGLTFNWFNLFLGVAICFFLSQEGGFLSNNWTIYIYLAIAVILHELGHVIFGKTFGCHIKEMQVFFLEFVSYKAKQDFAGSSWRNIKWSLGTIPLGGVTVFESRNSRGVETSDEFGTRNPDRMMASSPYIEDKPAWQRMLVSAGGVLFNLATFLIIYFALPYLSEEYYRMLSPLMSLSLILAVLNILPIYPLDGGAIVFALYEIIAGKKPSAGFTRICGWIGFIFIVLFFWVFPEWLSGILDSVFKVLF